MTTENVVLMKQARDSLSGKWGIAVGTFALYMVISVGIGSLKTVGSLISLLVRGPFTLGLCMFALSISRNGEPKLEQLFQGFRRFGTSFVTFLLMAIFVLLWAILLIIPGIIAAISYSQTFYILADDQNIRPIEAIKKSKKMMYGYKWKYVCLGLRFIGWLLLSILTLGIGLLWLLPYIQVSMAKFYDDLKAQPEVMPATMPTVVPQAAQ